MGRGIWHACTLYKVPDRYNSICLPNGFNYEIIVAVAENGGVGWFEIAGGGGQK